jgi:hypothetical protein
MSGIDQLVGVELVGVTGLEVDSEQVVFTSADGRKWRMWHTHDCCEWVRVKDVCGDASDLIDVPIMNAYCSESDGEYPGGGGTYTWTFYRISTIKGTVSIAWCGESNGHYSEAVYFEEVK